MILNTAPIARSTSYGVCLWWPEQAEAHVHPFDLGVARHLVPSRCVLRREPDESPFYRYSYGELSFRMQPALWLPVPEPEFELGELVEVRLGNGQLRPMVGRVSELWWNPVRRAIDYRLQWPGRMGTRTFRAEQLRSAGRLTKPNRLQVA